MNTLSWMTLLLAVATFSLAGMAYWNIRQANSLQKAERRERLLNEIIDWGIDFANVAFGHEMKTVPTEEDIREKLVLLGNKVFRYQAVDSRSPYIAGSAKVFGKELHEAVLAVASCRNDVALKTEKCLSNFDAKECTESLNKSEHELRDRALKVIALAATIKTKHLN